jgi:LPXTG-site transpeptidase (sortase) family protein
VTRLRPSHFVLGGGLIVLLVGGYMLLAPRYQAVRWQASPEAARAARNAEAPTPVWLRPTPAAPAGGALPAVTATPAEPANAVPTRTRPEVVAAPTVGLAVEVAPAATPTPSVSNLRLTGAAFEFQDSPEPGARAQLRVMVHNPDVQPSGPVTLALPLDWLAGYRIDSTEPELLNGVQSGRVLALSFPGAQPLADIQITVNVVAVDEVIDPPIADVFDTYGRKLGTAHPPTQAPAARPGPIYSIDIPKLHLHSGVVPVDWEPPLFVVGQVRTSAWVTLGNSVLVGHVRGAAGYNVFDHLDQLQPGDDIVANSRGMPYQFVVTQTEVLAEDDTSPTLPSVRPRLTLMTCTGDFDPIAGDYNDRLWVIAEPADEIDSPAPQPPPSRSPRGRGSL